MIRKINKGLIIIFIISWMFNCAEEQTVSGQGMVREEKTPKSDEVDLAPRPTRLKK